MYVPIAMQSKKEDADRTRQKERGRCYNFSLKLLLSTKIDTLHTVAPRLSP